MNEKYMSTHSRGTEKLTLILKEDYFFCLRFINKRDIGTIIVQSQCLLSVPRMCELESNQMKRLWFGSSIRSKQGKNYRCMQLLQKTATAPTALL